MSLSSFNFVRVNSIDSQLTTIDWWLLKFQQALISTIDLSVLAIRSQAQSLNPFESHWPTRRQKPHLLKSPKSKDSNQETQIERLKSRGPNWKAVIWFVCLRDHSHVYRPTDKRSRKRRTETSSQAVIETRTGSEFSKARSFSGQTSATQTTR